MSKHTTTKITDAELRELLAYSRALGREEAFAALRELLAEARRRVDAAKGATS